MNSLEALKKIMWETDTSTRHNITNEYMLVRNIRKNECYTIEKDLLKLQAIESADLSEGERVVTELKSVMTKRTMETFGKELETHDNNLFNSLDNILAKAKLLEEILKSILNDISSEPNPKTRSYQEWVEWETKFCNVLEKAQSLLGLGGE